MFCKPVAAHIPAALRAVGPPRQRGFTLVEMIITITVLALGLAGVLVALNVGVKSSADPLVRKQMLSIAENMMEEIVLKPYSSGPGAITGCVRINADDIADYSGYDQAVCDVDGTAISGLQGYRVRVTQSVGTVSSSTGVSAPAIKITVTVTASGDSLSLVGWRTDYAS